MDVPTRSSAPFAALSETHSAVVFFAGECALKLKKPVDLGFLDFTSLHARKDACAREVELNRRFAPDVYLGVAELHDPAGEVADYLVMMRRMPVSRRLSVLVRQGSPPAGALREVARKLAAVHAASPRRAEITAQGSRDALQRRWESNLAEARELPDSPLEAAVADEVQRLAGRFLAGRERLLAGRMEAGHVVDGHGDLLADDIFYLDDGPRILDCLEFDDRLRWLDGLDDAACLAMDLEYLGAPGLARQFIGWYSEFSGDQAPPALLRHYVAYRAFMRAKVAALRCSQGDATARDQAQSLAGIALRHLRAAAVTLVLVGGAPGTGKSTLAGQLAARLGFSVLSSDRIRKELAGLPPDQPHPAAYGQGIYSQDWSQRTYAELLRRAATLLEHGESVIADASWTASGQRDAAAAVAGATAADLIPLRCTAPLELAARRTQARTGGPSDAGPRIAAEMAAAEAPWPEATTVDTASVGTALQQAIAAIRPHGPEHAWQPTRPRVPPD